MNACPHPDARIVDIVSSREYPGLFVGHCNDCGRGIYIRGTDGETAIDPRALIRRASAHDGAGSL